VTLTFDIVTFPVLVTMKSYLIGSPTAAGDCTCEVSATFVSVSEGCGASGVSVVDGGVVTGGPSGGTPVAVAAFAT